MNEVMNYQNRKEEIRKKLRETAENFVYIGYQLKQVRESREYEQDGYADILEFAQKEYGLQKDDTYRFIRINDKYSINGNSTELAERFKGMAQTKLSEMLSLPDKDIDLITSETTRDDIRELKRFNNQSPEDVPEKGGSDIQNIILEYFRPVPGRPAGPLHELLLEVLEIVEGKRHDPILTQEELIQEKINPKGNGTFRAGRYMLFLYDAAHGLKYKVFGENENHQLSYLSFAKTIHLIFTSQQQNGMDPWESAFGKEEKQEPEKEKIPESDSQIRQPKPEPKTNVDKKKSQGNEESDTESYPQENLKNSEKARAQLEEESYLKTIAEDDESQTEEEEKKSGPETEEEEENGQAGGGWQQEQEEEHQGERLEAESDVLEMDPKQMEVEDYPELIPEGYIKCHDGSQVEETESLKKWKEIQEFVKDLNMQITNRSEPDLSAAKKIKSGVNYLGMIMEDFIGIKEESENE
ncbi:MAG: hypothetical protein LBN31_07580 [Hungatella sp.]|jgi:hypothetical protein|nr:hypothetical protein [Hungatella sp.]